MTTRYTVTVLYSGQPHAYGDTLHEYEIKCEMNKFGTDEMRPWIMFGTPTDERTMADQRAWAKRLVRNLCREFREGGDNDGRKGLDAAFYPTLRELSIRPDGGVIHALIVERYCD